MGDIGGIMPAELKWINKTDVNGRCKDDPFKRFPQHTFHIRELKFIGENAGLKN